MGDDFIKVVVVPKPGMSADWQTYRPKPTANTVKARRVEHAFTVEGQDLSGKAGDFIVDSGNGSLGVMTKEQFHAAFSAVRGPRPAPAPAAAGTAKGKAE